MRRLTLILACLVAALAISAAEASALPPVKHVFVIVLENENQATTFGPGSKAPYLSKTLTAQGQFLPNYYATGHFSLDNYITLVSGQAPNADTQADCQFYTDVTPGVIGPSGQAVGQGCVYPGAVKTVADQLAAKGLSWRGYMEDMGNSATESKTCRHPALNSQDGTQQARVGDQYAARHNPFVYFHSLIDGPACQANDVPLDRLSGELGSAASTPSYSFITPNLCHDGHDGDGSGKTCVDGEPGGLVSADAFLRTWVPRITGSPAYADGGLLAIIFDEAGQDNGACCGEPSGPNTPMPGQQGPGGGKVGAVLLSPFIQPGSVNQTPYNHYSLLRSVEDLFGLDHLGYAGAAGLAAFGADVFNAAGGGGKGGGGGNSGGQSGGRRGRRGSPRISLSGLPRRCVRRDFTARIRVRATGRLRRLVVRVDRRLIASSTRTRLRVRVRASALPAGRHRLRVRAVDRSGRATSLTRGFRRCGGPSAAAAPRFTG